MNTETISTSRLETEKIGINLGAHASGGQVYALIGELGSGKTVLAKGFARGLDITEDVTSPSFTLLEVYQGRIPFYHFDLYRIDDERELDNLFFEEYWEGDGVSVIEWADRARERLPKNTVFVYIDYIDDGSRRIKIEYPDS